MEPTRLGEIAALGTALLWTATYLQFTFAVRRIGAPALNRLRLTFALGFLLIAHIAVFGIVLPVSQELAGWAWLTLSGVVGFAISDALLFRGLYHLGAHRTSLIMSLIPLVSALLAWALFGERLSWVQAFAALVTVGGITLVVSARQPKSEGEAAGLRIPRLGILFALGAVLAQSLRYILSLQGMKSGFAPLSANLVQILTATTAVWIWSLVSKEKSPGFSSLRDRPAAAATVGGAMTGPFLGVALSMIALSKAPVGIASTLMALSPVFLLFVSRWVFKEPITVRAIVGTGLAVAGVAVLFLS